MVYVRLDDQNIIQGFYIVKIHGLKKCEDVISKGGIIISPSIWNVIKLWYKTKFIGVKNELNNYKITDFEEIKEVVDEFIPPKTEVEMMQEKIESITKENILLQDVNTTQDVLIDTTMLATDEIYMMIEPLLGSAPQNISLFAENINIKEGEVRSPMVDMYVAMVQRGLKTIDQVPVRYREEVRQILEQLEK